jgi:hypothetical protein
MVAAQPPIYIVVDAHSKIEERIVLPVEENLGCRTVEYPASWRIAEARIKEFGIKRAPFRASLSCWYNVIRDLGDKSGASPRHELASTPAAQSSVYGRREHVEYGYSGPTEQEGQDSVVSNPLHTYPSQIMPVSV